MSTRQNPHEHGGGAERLAAHIAECTECGQSPPALQRISKLLDSDALPLRPDSLSLLTLARLQPELQRRAHSALWRRVATSVLLALLPLPVVLVSDAYLLGVLYDWMQALLPPAVALYVLASYSAVISLLFAATYAAIPILLTRDTGGQSAPA